MVMVISVGIKGLKLFQ